MKKSFVCTIVCVMVSFASAFNHPEIHWKSVTTAHFIINYNDRTEPAVYATWKIAEAAYESLSSLYDYEARTKINISLADYDDYSNGFASWTDGSIMIWVTDIRFDLRGNNTWLNNVVTHELSHIMTLEKKSKMQLFDWSFSFNYASKSDTLSLMDPFATTRLFPEWLAEGIAQHESERRGNDCWDSKRDMLLKEAVVGGRALTLSEMGHFNHDDRGNEMVYNQGFSFIKFIEQKIGTSNLTGIFNASRNTALVSANFYSMFENQTGQSLAGLYHLWMDSIKAEYVKRMPQNPTQTTMIFNRGFYNFMPKISPDGKWWGWLTSNGDDFSRTDLVIAPYGQSKPSVTLTWALSSWDFSADSRKVYFIKSRELSDNGSALNDLYIADLSTKQERRLTRGARIYDVAACPDNQKIACVQYRDGAFSIITAGTDGCCWETLMQGEIGRPFVGLSFSPVKTSVVQPPVLGKKDSAAAKDSVMRDTAVSTTAGHPLPTLEFMIATTRYVNGKGTVCILGTLSRTLTMIGTGTAQEENPHWSKDGRIYFDADYDGTFNIYSMHTDGTGLSRHTDAPFGMMYPFTDDNSRLLCVSYANSAFSIVSCGLTQGAPYAVSVPKQYACTFTDLPRPKGEVTIKSRPYEAKLLRPVWELQSACEVFDKNETFAKALSKNGFNSWLDSTPLTIVTGLALSRSDALERKSVSMGVMAAVIHSGISNDSTDNGGSGNYFSGLSQSSMTNMQQAITGEKPQTLADRTAKSLLRAEPMIRRFSFSNKIVSSKAAATAAQADATGDSSVSQPQWTPIIDPSFSYLNNENTLSFGLDADVTCVYFIPYIFQVQGTSTWQISRDFYAGCFPALELVPISGFALPYAALPVAFEYSTYGYLNTDIAYNGSGLTHVQLLLLPETFLMASSSDTASSFSSLPRASSMTIALAAMHGFPVTKYSSVIVQTEESYTGLSDSLLDSRGLLPGTSTEYLSGDVGASFVFPLWRQINGGPFYADALYGTIGYDLGILTNTTTFTDNLLGAFAKSSFDKDHVCVSHVFSAGVRLGFYKSFLFSRTFVAKASWDVWKQKFSMNLIVGM
jgi:hypothetical protein